MTTTIIAKRTRIGGLVETEGDVVVEGRVEGTIRAGGCVTIAVSGVAVSDVEAGRAMVLGILIGNVTATERIDVAASARIVGDVRAPTVSVATAGLVEGRIEELNPEEDGEAKPTLRLRSGPVVRPAKPPSASYPPVVAARSSLPASPAGPARPPAPRGTLRETPTSELPTSPPRTTRHAPAPTEPARHVPAETLRYPPTEPARPPPTQPPRPASSSSAGPARHAAPTEPAEPSPPPIPRPPGRVRLIPRGKTGSPS